MPAKNSIKQYTAPAYYHVYNRGVEKRRIFQDQQDYVVFLSYLKTYLLPKDEEALQKALSDENTPYREKERILKLLRLNNFADTIQLLCYCLMPNHFHFAIKQTESSAIDQFMNSLATRYTMYFNKKYKRVGHLYQDVYKAVLVHSDEQLFYLTSYIHRNPLDKKLASQGDALRARILRQPSSYPDYLGERQTSWVYPEEILSHFSKAHPSLSYEAFVEQTDDYSLIEKETIDL